MVHDVPMINECLYQLCKADIRGDPLISRDRQIVNSAAPRQPKKAEVNCHRQGANGVREVCGDSDAREARDAGPSSSFQIERLTKPSDNRQGIRHSSTASTTSDSTVRLRRVHSLTTYM